MDVLYEYIFSLFIVKGNKRECNLDSDCYFNDTSGICNDVRIPIGCFDAVTKKECAKGLGQGFFFFFYII
jgi:hypothetical protein